MKKNFYLLIIAMFVGLVAKGETYTTNASGNVNSITWTKASGGTTVLGSISSGNSYIIKHTVNFANWLLLAGGSIVNVTIDSAGTINSSGESNVNITVKKYGSVNITGVLTQVAGGSNKIINEGTVLITGNVSNLASVETKGTGTTTIKGTVDNTSIITADAGAITVGTVVTNKDITNTNITIGAGSSMQLYGNLTESDPANQTLTNNGTTTITGRIAIKTTDNTGTLTVANIDRMNDPITVTNSGTMTVTTAQWYNDGKRSITNSGTITFNGDLTVNNANSGVENILSSTGTLTVGGSLSISNVTAPVSLNNTTVNSTVTISKATVSNTGKLDVGVNLSLDEGNLTVNGNLKVTQNISLNKGSLTTGNGTTNTAKQLNTSNPPTTLTNNGSLIIDQQSSFSNDFKLINNSYLKLPGSYSFAGAGQLSNNGTIDISGSLSFDGSASANNSLNSKINITGDLNISGASNFVNNYGDITVGGKLNFSNGNLNNYKTLVGATTIKGRVLVAGTGSLLNATVHVTNDGVLDFAQKLSIINTTIDNHDGQINARGGIYLENDGCASGGSIDYWGNITRNAAAENLGNYKCKFVGVIMPIVLVEFKGLLKNNEVELSWITSSETNNDFFQLEVSTDGRNYSLLGTIDGAGNSTVQLQYEFLHNQPSNGVNYYRLSQTDFDGQKQYFAPIAVHYSNLEALIYPTVIHGDDIVNIQLSSVTEDVPFQIISQDGKILNTGTISNIAELPSDLFQYGLNQLIIGSDNSIIKTSIVKQ